MNPMHTTTFLRRVLAADALCSAAMASVLLLFSAQLVSFLSLPAGLIRGAGWALIPFATFVGWLACAARPARLAVSAVIAINVLWVVDSFVLLLAGWAEPNAWGLGFVIVQACAVAAFAGMQYAALRSTPGAPALAA